MPNSYYYCEICHRKDFLVRLNSTNNVVTLICKKCGNTTTISLRIKSYTTKVIPEYA